ncbi:hypothetical protein KFK09_014772 [Dendrobium nobile]|uniref:Uncharacterized protein n=1 Tax=Dendrobium nobile TaxID=94219 RepID=A0A8T3B4V8_DENNO|nr:hypothetical protein KFK09_014772 [Dendrobium nobile]
MANGATGWHTCFELNTLLSGKLVLACQGQQFVFWLLDFFNGFCLNGYSTLHEY